MIDIITLNSTEAEVIYVFAKNIERRISMLQIAKEIKKHYPNVFKAVKNLQKKGLLKTAAFGRATACSLNASNPLLPAFLAFVAEQKSYAFLEKYPFLKSITSEIRKIAPECSAGIFGSHADGTATNKSDIDLFVIADSQNIGHFKNFIQKHFPEHEGKVHLAALSFEEFSESAVSKEYTFGKEIAKKGVVFSGGETFYQVKLKWQK